MKTFKEIKDLLKEEDDNITPEEKGYCTALDQLHDFYDSIEEDDNEDFSMESIRQEAQEIVDHFASQNISIDLNVLLNDFFEEAEIDFPMESITTSMFGIDFLKDQFADYKTALKDLEMLIQKESEKGGKLKTIEFYAQKVDHRRKGKLDPRKLAALYRKKRALKECLIKEEKISDDDLQTLADILDSTKSDLSDDLLKAFITHNIKKIEKIIRSEIKNENKAKKIIIAIKKEMED